jgi:antitoxin HicB
MVFYAKIVKTDDVFLVSFPDMENINTYGDTLEDAQNNASEALNGALAADFDRGFELPKQNLPQRLGRTIFPIDVYPHIAITYMLRKLRKNNTQVEIAHKLGISYQAYQKLENPRKCNPTIKTLEKISSVLHKKLQVSFI